MKTKIFILFGLLSPCFTFTQTDEVKGWEIGIHGMTNLNKVYWTEPETFFMPDLFYGHYGIYGENLPFRASFGAGVSGRYHINDKWTFSLALDWNNRKTAVPTTGWVVEYIFTPELYSIYHQTDYMSYKYNQLSLAFGLAYKPTRFLSLELAPYFQQSISKQQMRYSKNTDWKESQYYVQNYDFGISGKLQFDIERFYIFAGYQFGLRKPSNYLLINVQYNKVANIPTRNTMILFGVGFSIWKSLSLNK